MMELKAGKMFLKASNGKSQLTNKRHKKTCLVSATPGWGIGKETNGEDT
jgi:hypothetical protein